MDLRDNQAIIISNDDLAGIYRVVLSATGMGQLVLARLDAPRPHNRHIGRPRKEKTKRPLQKTHLPLVGGLIWVDEDHMRQLEAHIRHIDIELDSIHFNELLPGRAKDIYDQRLSAMEGFLDPENLRHRIVFDRGIGGLVRAAKIASGCSRSQIYILFSLLCRYGFSEHSLRPRLDLCGGLGVARPCVPEGRQKAGRKTEKQRIAKASGIVLPPEQPGMNTNWRDRILAADSTITIPKPPMPTRCKLILGSHFVKKYRHEAGNLVPIDLKLGEYPNDAQIERVLNTHYDDIERAIQKTTKRHFERNQRGLTGKNWEGVSGPGHTWAIDSTVGDVYLRSTVDRTWIVGRPVVYVIVDVWSTAIVGFYVCLTGPSWDMAKVALFCAATDPGLIAQLWGYQPVLLLDPAPTMPFSLLCDRGEYLSQAARVTGSKLLPCMSYTPPYHGDFKGGVEVVHRIEKDQQFFFIPGAIDARRAEYELRRFNPEESVMTVREYTCYLQSIFTRYNFSANREHRLDAHMKAQGVDPSPAGLWSWGHAMGIGVRRNVTQSNLITDLLPQSNGRITRNEVKWAGNEYSSKEVIERQWATHARNYGGTDINAYYFPGSVSKIWTPNLGGKGLLELDLKDYSNASPELTVDDLADSQAYFLLNNAERKHKRTMLALEEIRRADEIINNAKRLTAEAEANNTGARPSMTEARALEKLPTGNNTHAHSPTEFSTPTSMNEAAAAHAQMMQRILDVANMEADHV